jgi:Asp-tRNA(Asn)/Glu-tRNA(Gln) amidotransferase A subunit family amidase
MLAKVGAEKISEEYMNSIHFPAPEKFPDYIARLKLRAAVAKRVSEAIESLDLDAVILPYQAVPPPPWDAKADKYSSEERSNNFTSATGLPGIIMPGGYTKENLPVAIQFVGKPWSDLNLLQVAYGYEKASKRRKLPESVPVLPGERFDY